jgi:ribonuclease-3
VLVHRLFDPVIARSARLGAGLDWKTSLQELTAASVLGVPEYHVDESGPDHQKSFRALVRVGGRVYGSGTGRSKKEAEQHAAEAAWSAISNGEAGVQADDAGSGADAEGNGAGSGPRGNGAGKDAADRGAAHAGRHHAGGNGAGGRDAADHGAGAGRESP